MIWHHAHAQPPIRDKSPSAPSICRVVQAARRDEVSQGARVTAGRHPSPGTASLRRARTSWRSMVRVVAPVCSAISV
jgi:hypothetical protein